MATVIELALMAGDAYHDNTAEINRFPVPDGWSELRHRAESSGFEAISYFNGTDIANSNEIVISFAGTDQLVDWDADMQLGLGNGSEQLLQAAEFYLQVTQQVKALNPNATITLTGHSLGGGLAALVGVFFGKEAVTFDQAPFAKSAEYDQFRPDVAAELKTSLLGMGYSEADLSCLTNFLQEREVNGGIPNDILVRNIRVDGEFLSIVPPLSLFDPIGLPTAPLDHGPYFAPLDLHSQALLTAFLQSDQSAANNGIPGQTLSEVTKKLTDLLGMFFDSTLYAHTTNDPDNVNLLEHLIRHQEGLDPTVPNDGDHMLERFTSDLWKIAQDGGLTMANNDLSKALTAFAMQMYYENPEATAVGKELFTGITGGIRFDRNDVASTLVGAKGNHYFTDYLNSLPPEDKAAIEQQLPNLLDWHIQAGNQAMAATAGAERAFMLGGSGDDHLTGGSQADVLVGNGGNDTVSGGASDDLMIGGEGEDIYIIDGNDTIRDTGRNIIVYQGQVLSGVFLREGTSDTYRFEGDNSITLTFGSQGQLVLNGTDSITFAEQASAADFAIDDFGIQLYDGSGSIVLTGTVYRDEMSLFNYSGTNPENWHFMFTSFPNGTTINTPSYDKQLPAVAPRLEVTGGGSGDFLFGFYRQDHINGGAGNDIINGNMTTWNGQVVYQPGTVVGDLLEGGAGDDWILGSGGDDHIIGGAGDDIIQSLDGKDHLSGDGGNDVLAGGSYDDDIAGGDGDDVLLGDGYYTGEDFIGIDNRSQFKMVLGYSGTVGEGYPISASSVNFGVQIDAPNAGNDILSGGAGRDLMSGGSGNDTLRGEAGHDYLMGDEGNDSLDGGAGNDCLAGGVGNDTYVFNPGGGADIIQLDPGGYDTVAIGMGYGPSALNLSKSGSDMIVRLNDGSRLTFTGWFSASQYPIERFTFAAGSQLATAEFMANSQMQSIGSTGDDRLDGYDGADVMSGGVGNDYLEGYGGNDTLDGGGGYDDLYGGVGNDTYVFGLGSGQDLICETGGADTIRFTDVLPTDIEVTRNQHDLSIAVRGTADSLIVAGWLDGNAARIERAEFSDGTVWDAATLEGRITAARGTSGNDVLYGGTGSDTYVLNPGGGADIIHDDPGGFDTVEMGVDYEYVEMGAGYESSFMSLFKSGSDMIVRMNDGTQFSITGWFSASQYPIERFTFKSGHQLTSAELLASRQMQSNGTAVNEKLYGYSGADKIYGGAGYDELYGYDGDDYLYGGADGDTLYGGDGNDYLDGGGSGHEYLYGGDGEDIYVFGRGYYRAWVDDSTHAGGQWENDNLASRQGDVDTILFGDGITSADLQVAWDGSTWDGDYLYLAIDPGWDDLVTVVAHHGHVDRPVGIEQLKFANGETLSVAGLLTQLMTGTSGNDRLYGTISASTHTMNGLDGNDVLCGYAGDETLIGGRGNDSLDGSGGNDLLYGGEGDDSLQGSGYLDGGDGNDSLGGEYGQTNATTLIGGNGNDYLYGAGGADLLNGGSGNDSLDGGGGADVYRFNIGGGSDSTFNMDWYGCRMSEDTVSFGSGIALADLELFKSPDNNLIMKVGINGDQITFNSWYQSYDWLEPGLIIFPFQVGQFAFADGTVMSAEALLAQKTIHVMPIMGSGGNDYLYGSPGDDPIYGGAGDDTIIGGTGADAMAGGSGDDTYCFSFGDGADTIDNNDIMGVDTVAFGYDISLYDLELHESQDDLIVKIGGDGDQLTIVNWVAGSAYQIDRFTFVDGTELSTAELLAQIPLITTRDLNLVGTVGDDTLFGSLGNDILMGAAGDDYMMGDDGNDSLVGGPGDDYLDGGNGPDVYLFNIGDGCDTIANEDGDHCRMDEDTVSFGSGIGLADLELYKEYDNLVMKVGSNSDQITFEYWYEGYDWQEPGRIFFPFQVGQFAFADGTVLSADELLSQKNIRIVPIQGGDGDDYLFGSSSEDLMDGGAGNDCILGHRGADTITGGVGDDNITGGFGADIITGGDGDDNYIFGLGDGADTIDNYDTIGTDILCFWYSISLDGLELYKTQDDLIVKGGVDGNQLTIANWFTGSAYQLDYFIFYNDTPWSGTALSTAQLLAQKPIITLSDLNLAGTVGDDLLTGTADNDIIQGGVGNDLLSGGDGNDTYLFNPGDGVDQIVDSGGADAIQFGAGITPDSLSLGLGSLLVRVGDQGDAIHIGDFNPADPLNSSVIDTFQFADGTVLDIADLLTRGFDIQGSDGDDLLTGTAINDRITGGEGSDTLAGGKGDDLLAGGGDNDTYVFNLGDGVDTIEDVSNAVEGNRITFGVGIASSDFAFERDGADLIIYVDPQGDAVRLKDFDRFGNNGSLVADTLQFADGSQASLFQLTNTAPVVAVIPQNQAALEGVAYSFTIPVDTFVDVDAGDSLTYSAALGGGNALPTWLVFDPATRTFSGTPANGDVGALAVDVTATDAAGTSAVASFALDIAHHIVGTASGNIHNGSELRDVIEGLGGDDSINGGAGADTMVGGLGNDLFYADNIADLVIENAGEGTDRVYTTVSHALGDNIENLTLSGASVIDGTGNSLNNTLVGNAAANILHGLAGNDDINGGAGADTMIGGLGNDIFTVDNGADLAIENAGEGSDRVYAAVSFALSDNIENLYFTGSNTADGTGNSLNNIIEGNTAANILCGLAGDDTINGGAGADTMIGGLGNDIFTVDDGADLVIEDAGEGTDLVYATISYALGDTLEKLTLTGASVIDGTGNNVKNVLIGNTAANILSGLAGDDELNGGSGADTMAGGLGSDLYYVDNVADLVIENAGEGTDRVYTTVSYALGDNIDNLTLSGASCIDATGNSLNNTIVGNVAANILHGLAGNDTLTGDKGDDTYVLGRGDGTDTVVENDTTVGNHDVASFLGGIAADQLWFHQINSADLEVNIIGTMDKLIFKNWYTGPQCHVEEFNTADGQVLSASGATDLATAMASLAMPLLGQFDLPGGYPVELQQLIDTSWN